MTQTMKSQKEFSTITNNSLSSFTQTNSTPTFTLVQSVASPLPVQFTLISDLIARDEAIPERAKMLADARKWLAEKQAHMTTGSIKTLRLTRGLSQSQLASLSSTTQAQIAKIESGGNVQIDTLERVAKGLDVSVEVAFTAYQVIRESRKQNEAA